MESHLLNSFTSNSYILLLHLHLHLPSNCRNTLSSTVHVHIYTFTHILHYTHVMPQLAERIPTLNVLTPHPQTSIPYHLILTLLVKPTVYKCTESDASIVVASCVNCGFCAYLHVCAVAPMFSHQTRDLALICV